MLLQRVLWCVALGAQSLVAGAIIHRKLARRYPVFLAYLLINLGCSFVLMAVPYHTLAYSLAFRFFQPLESIMELAVAVEVFDKLCASYRIIVWVRFVAGILLSSVIGVALLELLPKTSVEQAPHIFSIWLERWESAALLLALIGMWTLVYWLDYTPELSRNINTHLSALCAYLAVNAVGTALTLTKPYGEFVLKVNIGMMLGYLLCFAMWIRFLREGGETVPTMPEPSPEDRRKSEWFQRLVRDGKNAR